MRALELQRLSGMGESLGDRTLRVAERVTFWLVGGGKVGVVGGGSQLGGWTYRVAGVVTLRLCGAGKSLL